MDASSTVEALFDFLPAKTCTGTITYSLQISETVTDVPLGMNPTITGTRLSILDGENPAQYRMVIKATHSESNMASIFSPEITLIVKCPDTLIFNSPSYNPIW